jgi:hypothetical protein
MERRSRHRRRQRFSGGFLRECIQLIELQLVEFLILIDAFAPANNPVGIAEGRLAHENQPSVASVKLPSAAQHQSVHLQVSIISAITGTVTWRVDSIEDEFVSCIIVINRRQTDEQHVETR